VLTKSDVPTRFLKKSNHLVLLTLVPQKKLTRHLVENSFLNEGRFVEAYIEGKVTIKRWGVNKIRNELFKKFVSKEYIDQGVLNINRDLYKDNLDGLALKKKGLPKKRAL
jgi:regulatory protein